MQLNNTKLVVILLLGLMVIGFGVGGLMLALNSEHLMHGKFSSNINSESSHHSLGERKIREDEINLNKNINSIKIVNSVGDVNIEYYDGNDIKIVYNAYERSSLEVDKNTREIKIEGKVDKRDKSLSGNISNVELNIKVPASYDNDFKIKNGVGTINCYLSSYQYLEIKNGVGDINIYTENVGESFAKLGVGSLKFVIPKQSELKVEAKTGVGSISNRFDFDYEDSNGKFISDRLNASIGDDKVRVILEVGTGDIKIR
ncbi:DUF4097 family beta strand repeat-containing protein [Proteinivorax tanatarense]|uniref:DUF4097 family beta strand repeat-containing protein n=1 Tax=Proteinivorax tanatarense TaxID=1260629 RepID=A0AAU7VJQ0_9FIRM